jgi:hypothetical protein
LVRWALGQSTNFFLCADTSNQGEQPRLLSRNMVGILLDLAMPADPATASRVSESWLSQDGTLTVWACDPEKTLG